MVTFFFDNASQIKQNKSNFFFNCFFILFGFFFGNLWGSVFSLSSLPPIFFVITVVFFLEIISYIYYKIFDSKVFKEGAFATVWPGLHRINFFNRTIKPVSRYFWPYKKSQTYSNPLFAQQITKQLNYTDSGKSVRDSSQRPINNFVGEKPLFLFNKNKIKSLYLLKVGLLFGLFVDAFKVGS